ncbi:MAG TPA: hydrogenase maturation protease [Bryobacteraceae bacterium]|nr:hydrogenase maturation protease [Bryobacteraceae bacterium]
MRVIGIGSPFGDDAAGLEAARILARNPPPGCEVLAADRPGAGLLELLDTSKPVILIDAVRSGAAPGTLHELSFDDLDRCGSRFVSSHELGVGASIQLARKLGCAPAPGWVLGIEIPPETVRIPCPLSRTVRRAVKQAVLRLPHWVDELGPQWKPACTSDKDTDKEASDGGNREDERR